MTYAALDSLADSHIFACEYLFIERGLPLRLIRLHLALILEMLDEQLEMREMLLHFENAQGKKFLGRECWLQ